MTAAQGTQREGPAPVTLINVFEVPQGREDEFLAGWQRTAAFMRQQPGFRATRLPVIVSEQAQLRNVNVAECERPAAFQRAVDQDAFRAGADAMASAEAHPTLCRLAAAS